MKQTFPELAEMSGKCPVMQQKKKTMESNRICFIIATMANQVIRDLVLEIKGNFFSIICDEFTDISNKEQLTIFFRWVDKELEACNVLRDVM